MNPPQRAGGGIDRRRFGAGMVRWRVHRLTSALSQGASRSVLGRMRGLFAVCPSEPRFARRSIGASPFTPASDRPPESGLEEVLCFARSVRASRSCLAALARSTPRADPPVIQFTDTQAQERAARDRLGGSLRADCSRSSSTTTSARATSARAAPASRTSSST